MRNASEGLRGRGPSLFSVASLIGSPLLGRGPDEMGHLSPETGVRSHFVVSSPPPFSSMQGISPTLLLFAECIIPTVVKDDILEWPPD